MAFVCTVDDVGSDYAEFYRATGRNAHALTIPVGYDPSTDRSYTLMVCLGPDAVGYDEFSFCMIEYDAEIDAEYTIWSGREIAHKIHAADRAKILKVLLRAAAFFATTQPRPKILMQTIEPTSDGAPLRKYVMIARTFEKYGYRISMPNVYHGLRTWMMERDASQSIDNVSDEPFMPPSDGE